MRWWLKTTKPVHMENLRQLCLPANYSWPVKDVEVFKGVQKFYYDNAGGEMKCLTAEEFKEDE